LPNLAFLLICLGILLIYCEFVWVGKVVFGVFGAVCALAGTAALAAMPHTALGLALIAGSLICFAVEASLETSFVAGVAGSALWAFGFWKLFPAPMSISPLVAFPVSAFLGSVTTWLLWIAKRARRNKRVV
jgi:membrane-bound ClpP family serine protease